MAFSIGMPFWPKISIPGNDSDDTVVSNNPTDINIEAPNLNLAGEHKSNMLMSALAIMGIVAPDSPFTQYIYDELHRHLNNDKNIDGLFDKLFSGSVFDSGSGSDSVSSDSVSDIKDNFLEYFQGLATNQGKENQLNRLYNSAEALANREFQSAEAQKQRDWYEAMSNTAYTRAVADMKNAGINPILAYAQGGASSSGTGLPSSSAASYNSTGGDTMSSLLSAMADVIYAVSGASSQKVSTAFKMFRMAGG